MFKLDLHTHSSGSRDGGLRLEDYRLVLKEIDYIAITDHDNLSEAKKIQAALGERIIVGCEVTTSKGDVIGLYIENDIPPGLSLKDTIENIHGQGGLVMIPHPFERWQRGSVTPNYLRELASSIDIIETYNGRSLSLAGRFKARRFARHLALAQASNSDAHGLAGIGKTYTIVKQKPTPANLVSQLKSARFVNGRVRFKGYLEPTINRRRRDKIGPENNKGFSSDDR